MENSKANEPHKFVTNILSERLDLKSSNKHVAFHNVCIYYTWKNIKSSIRTQSSK